ncbi:homing endonuclease [Synechococcus phage S-CBWM1]|uniref:Homing endonuclease n=1 Tax=Synechococcus phage S-CBWM1 TaxID=2053653 RepID=A0A3G1L3X2_9CAUD|nr:homing endonuclease [Synechococcus phage S-CBWM1]ATW62840.1 homing endonuclease [Synechococcus phage S-CBWM1]
MNRYEKFISHLKKKEPAIRNSSLSLQKHRIIPGHSGGDYSEANVVICSIEDHIKAHRIRYEVYGERGDKFAVSMMTGRLRIGDKVVATLGAYSTHEVCKENKTGFWSSETQRKNALKGDTPEVLQKKSEGGKRGNEVIRKLGIGAYAPGQTQKSGRASALKRWGIPSDLYGRIYFSAEQRVSISETFFDYYVAFGNPWQSRAKPQALLRKV